MDNSRYKFRAWYETENRMLDWDELQDGTEQLESYFNNELHDVSPVMQFTGLKDIEQFEEPRELYTGDIVSMHQFLFDGEEWENEVIGVLEYDEDVAAVCLTKIKHHDIRKYMGFSNPEEFKDEKIPVCMFYGLHETSWTYLGNIYENPELLK